MSEPRATHHRWDDLPKEPLKDDLSRRLISTDRMMLAQVFLEKGCVVPLHSHENEQLTYILEGKLRFWLGEDESETVDVGAGEVLHIPSWVPHKAEALETTLDVDIFARRDRTGSTGRTPTCARSEARARRSPRADHGRVEGARRGDRARARLRGCPRRDLLSQRAGGDRNRRGGRRRVSQAADVTDPEQVRDLIARTAEALGGIDFLVNNAGGAHPGTFETLSDEDWAADLDVKLFSLIRCSREVLPHLRAAGGGRIVNIGAVYSRYPDPAFFATSVNRAAGNSFTKTLALEVAKDNILVNGVNIGFVITPQWENIRRRRPPS